MSSVISSPLFFHGSRDVKNTHSARILLRVGNINTQFEGKFEQDPDFTW